MNVRIATCATAILLALAAPAHAEVVTIEYAGTLPAGTDWPAGVVLSGQVTYDTEATPLFPPDPTAANYPVISSVIELNGVQFVGTFGSIQIQNNIPQFTSFRDAIALHTQVSGPFQGVQVTSLGFALFQVESPAPTATTSVDLPDENADLAGFTQTRRMNVSYQDQSDTFQSITGTLSSIAFVTEDPPILTRTCDGFYAPLDEPVSLARKSNRVLPLKLLLLDENLIPLGPDAVVAPPVVNVEFAGAFIGGDPVEFVDSAGRATEGNAFVWDEVTGTWTYNLGTRSFKTPGTYSVSVLAGDASYAITPPGCAQIFVRE